MSQNFETCGQGWFEQGAFCRRQSLQCATPPPPPLHLSVNHKLISCSWRHATLANESSFKGETKTQKVTAESRKPAEESSQS